MNKQERTKMVKAMEFIARHINDESIFESWLVTGVADGDIEYGDLDDTYIDEYYLEKDNFKDLMSLFMKLMKSAYTYGGICCDNIGSKK